MGTGPIARRPPVEQLGQPARLAQLRTDAQHADGRCQRLRRTLQRLQQVRSRGFAYLLYGQHTRSVGLAISLYPASAVEAVHAHYHVRVVSLGAGIDPGFEHLARGFVALVVEVGEHVAFQGRQVGRKLAGRRLIPLRLEAVEKTGKFNECAGLHQFADYLVSVGERLHGAIPQVHLEEGTVPFHGNCSCPTTLSHTRPLRKEYWIHLLLRGVKIRDKSLPGKTTTHTSCAGSRSAGYPVRYRRKRPSPATTERPCP